jgi:UMF1 family MFS transporter
MDTGGTPKRRAIIAWCFYDWANSAFPTVIGTFIFGAYYTQAIAASPEEGAAEWGVALGLSAVLVALASPVLGAIADRAGRRKAWIGVFTALCVGATALLWFATPDPSSVLYALILVALASAAFEFTTVFYNAMLADLAPASHIGRISGWGWGLGYGGGLAALVLCLVGFVQAETPWFGVTKEAAAHIRAVTLLVAVWYAVFSLPLFWFAPDVPSRGIGLSRAAREGVAALIQTLRQARRHGNIIRFLIARMLYADGLGTLFAFGGIYAAGTFGMTLAEVIQFGIALNVTAGLGAAAFAWMDDRIGAKPVIVVSLVALIGFGAAMLLVESVLWFWIFGLALGIFVGPAQAASRSLMARLAPAETRTEMFGLYAFSGKATGFLGPFILAAAITATGSQRAGMAVIIVLFAAGLLLLLPVREPRPSAEIG